MTHGGDERGGWRRGRLSIEDDSRSGRLIVVYFYSSCCLCWYQPLHNLLIKSTQVKSVYASTIDRLKSGRRKLAGCMYSSQSGRGG